MTTTSKSTSSAPEAPRPLAVDPARIPLRDARVAIVHDWLTGYRGGEKVLEAILELYPQAELFSLFYVPGSLTPFIEDRPIHTSWMDRIPGIHRRYPWLLPLFPAWADRLDLSGFDLVLSVSTCVAKGARARPGALHVCYCNTPMRYVWDRFEDYFGRATGLKRRVIEAQAARLRRWDVRSSDRVDWWMPNSSFIEYRLRKYFDADPDRMGVVFPFADLQAFGPVPPDQPRDDRYLVVSALVPYKRIDVAVEAVARSGRRLTVAGKGAELPRLQRMAQELGAADRIEFRGFVPDEELPGLYASHRAMLFPGVEDFGITPVEASASGLPVVARAEGGVLDTVVDGLNGVLYQGAGAAGLAAALDDFEARPGRWDAVAMRAQAARFSREAFQRDYVEQLRAAVAAGPRPR